MLVSSYETAGPVRVSLFYREALKEIEAERARGTVVLEEVEATRR